MTEPSFWDERYSEESCIWGHEPSLTVRSCLSILNDYGTKDILDLGCGYGRDALYLTEKGFNVTGIDSSEEALKLAKAKAEDQNLDVKFLHLEALDLSHFSDNFFDAVVSHRFFHLILDVNQQQAVIAELYRILKPGGIVSLSLRGVNDPSRNNSKQSADGSEELAFRPGHKIKVMTSQELRMLFQSKNRFHVQETKEFCELETERGDIKATLLHIRAIKC